MNAYSSNSIHKGEHFKPTKPRGLCLVATGSIPGMQGDGVITELGGIMEVSMLNFD